MGKDVSKEEQLAHVAEYYRSFIQSALEPILFNQIEGVDWQVLIGSFLQDQLADLHQLNQAQAIQYLFERKPSQRVKELLRSDQEKEEKLEERRSGLDRRSSEGIDRRSHDEDMAKITEDMSFLFEVDEPSIANQK